MTNLQQEELKMRLEAMARQINGLSPEEKAKFFKDVAVRKRLIEAEMKDVDETIKGINKKLQKGTKECSKRETVITVATLIACATLGGAVGYYTGLLEGIDGIEYATGSLCGVFGGFLGVPASLGTTVISEKVLKFRKHLLNKKQDKLKHKLYKDEYVVSEISKLESEENQMA